jgi:hypothetical protein
MTTRFRSRPLAADRRLPWNTRLATLACERKSRRNPHARVGALFASIHPRRPIRLRRHKRARNAGPRPRTPRDGSGLTDWSAFCRACGQPKSRGHADPMAERSDRGPAVRRRPMRRDDKISNQAPRSWARGDACQPRAEGASLNDPYHLIDAGPGILTARPHITVGDRMGSQAGRLFHGRSPSHAS